MKKVVTICWGILVAVTAFTAEVFAQEDPHPIQSDSAQPVDFAREDEMIDDVVRSGNLPTKDKVEYINQTTKYGFKTLFANYSYSTTMPYTAQVNPNAEGFISDYMRTHSRHLIKMKGWGQPYFNLIENVLVQYGLPRELKYIAVIESNLSTAATSRVGAGGPWQFMPYTAKEYGLKITRHVDERRDYYKSTHAAARYLLALYRQLHDWLLVMAAYNGGPGRVYSAMKKSGSKNFWSLQYHLPEESRIYVKRFIATHYIMEGSGGITTMGGSGDDFVPYGENGTALPVKPANNLTDAEMESAELMSVSGKFISRIIAKNLSMEIAAFNHYNPDFDAILNATGIYDLRLPSDKMQLFVTKKYDILNECVELLLNDAAVPKESKTGYPSKNKKKLR